MKINGIEIPAHLEHYVLDHAAAAGKVVCQGHADICALIGHGVHTQNKVESPWCSRCGVMRDITEAEYLQMFGHPRNS